MQGLMFMLTVCLILSACEDSTKHMSSASLMQNALLSAELEWPESLAATHVFKDVYPPSPAASLVQYEVAVPLWSDGAVKFRYVFVPTASTLTHDETTGEIDFPIGTVLVKHFSEQESGEPIETRLIVRKDDGTWSFATYAWDDNGGATYNQRPRSVTKQGSAWRIPSESECRTCHSETRPVLGFNLQQLNIKGRKKSQLEELSDQGISWNKLSAAYEIRPLDSPANENLSINRRARSYIEVNCSPCHNPKGPAGANRLDLRLDAIDTKLLTEGKIVPGKPEESILWKRISGDKDRMPPLSLRPDDLGTQTLTRFIAEWPQ